jgi:cytochrome c-type biogenesis protein
MVAMLLAAGAAFWFGVLTSLAPCPLATNIAAISFIGRQVGSPRKAMLAGVIYTAGRAATYVVLGVLLVWLLRNTPGVAQVLQRYMNKILGLVLIVVGMFLAGLIRLDVSASLVGEKTQKRVAAMGMLGVLLLGALFAVSFCPGSAALFFGSLIPLAVERNSGVLLPLIYGVGTGLPVLVFAVLIAFGANRVGAAFNKLTAFEKWARVITGVVFIGVGIYFCLTYIYGVFA